MIGQNTLRNSVFNTVSWRVDITTSVQSPYSLLGCLFLIQSTLIYLGRCYTCRDTLAESINISEHELRIARNLEAALRHLQRPTEDIVL